MDMAEAGIPFVFHYSLKMKHFRETKPWEICGKMRV